MSLNTSPDPIDVPKRSRLLSVLSRQPLRRFFPVAERALERRLSAPHRQLIDSHEDLRLVYHDEQVWVALRTRGFSSRSARRHNIDLVSEILRDASVPFFALPDQSRRHASLGVDAADWDRFAEALVRTETVPPIYLGIAGTLPDGQTQRITVLAGSPEGRRALKTQDFVDVFRFYAEEGKAMPFGRGDSCRVERWRRDEHGTLEGTVKNNRATTLDLSAQEPAVTGINGLSLPTFAPLAEPNIFEFTQPIDVVYMWVDGHDAAWRKKRDAVIEQLTGTIPTDSYDPSRFRDNGELRYSMRSLFQHCEWVRNIILVTDSQVPDWLDVSHPRIRMVNHQELFGDAGALPTFNSHAIASRVHHIEGLSEQYLIFNDDVFIGHSTGPEKFFLSNGTAKFFLSQSTLQQRKEYDQAHDAARRNVAELLKRDFGVAVNRIFWHTPVAQVRSLLFELEERYPHAFTSTWSHQLRSSDDYEVNGWMHHYFGYLLRRTVPGSIRYDYFNLGAENLIPRLERLYTNRNVSTFCLNDSPDAPAANLEFVHEWLQRYFPVAAPWEKDA